jgi:hypothetical protein
LREGGELSPENLLVVVDVCHPEKPIRNYAVPNSANEVLPLRVPASAGNV